MARKIRLTDAQFAVLEQLWGSGPQTIRQLTAALYPAEKASEYATIQKLIEQLEEKRCVHRDRSRMTHVVRPVVDRTDLIDSQLQDITEKLCGGSLTPVLMRLVERCSLTSKQRALLSSLLNSDECDTKGKDPGKRNGDK